MTPKGGYNLQPTTYGLPFGIGHHFETRGVAGMGVDTDANQEQMDGLFWAPSGGCKA